MLEPFHSEIDSVAEQNAASMAAITRALVYATRALDHSDRLGYVQTRARRVLALAEIKKAVQIITRLHLAGSD